MIGKTNPTSQILLSLSMLFACMIAHLLTAMPKDSKITFNIIQTNLRPTKTVFGLQKVRKISTAHAPKMSGLVEV